MKMTNYLGEELANKVYHLHQALEQAKKIISILEKENNSLKETIRFIEEKDNLVAA